MEREIINGLSVDRVLGSDHWPDTVMDEIIRTGKGCSFIPCENVFVAGLDGEPVINLGECLQEFGNIGLIGIHSFSIQEVLIRDPLSINGNNLSAKESRSFQETGEEIRREAEAWVQSRYGDKIVSMSKNGDGKKHKGDIVFSVIKSPKWNGHKGRRNKDRSALRNY